MTATSAGSSSSLAAKGLDISLAALQRQDPYINNIVDVASQVALYTYNYKANEWEKTDVEGTLFIYRRLASPRHGFTIMNRLSMENLTEPITKALEFQLQDPFLLYRNARLVIHGIWFYDKEDCQRIAQKMKTLTQQEQVLAQSQGAWFSPGEGTRAVAGGGGEAKAVDIIQMLTKARTEYDKDKSTSEPKEIGGSGVLCGNPNLVKPIPVKPNIQDSEGAEPKSLPLAALFGYQHPHHLCKPDSVPLVNSPATGISTRKASHTLTYEETLNSVRNLASNGGIKTLIGETGGNTFSGLLQSPTNARQHQLKDCSAIAKLMQGQKGVGSIGGVLHTVSESPENQLCDNGVPLEHQHQQHLCHHLQQHHHQQELQPDPIKRLFQTHPPPPPATSSTMSNSCSNPPSLQQTLHLSSQPAILDTVPCPHFQAQQNQQLSFGLSNSLPEMQHSSQTASATKETGLPSQMPGISPRELFRKLQQVQQEQNLVSNDLPRLCPGLAPRFLGPAQNQVAGSDLGTVPNPTPATTGQKAVQPLQVISPQRIPATVAPTLLLSPSVFTQTKPSGGLSAVGKEIHHTAPTLPRPLQQEEIGVLSKSQLKATLLYLIQTDSLFLDIIHEAYVRHFAKSSSSKY